MIGPSCLSFCDIRSSDVKMAYCYPSQVNCGIHIIDVLLIQAFPQILASFAKALEMDDLPLPEEFDDVIDIRVVRQPQDVVIGRAGLLFWERIP